MPVVSEHYSRRIFDEPASMANTFQNEDVDMIAKTLTFYTELPGTETTFEMYLLSGESTSPTDGELLASGTKTYEYGGYHRFDLEEPVYIPANAKFSVVVTNKTAEGKYEITDQEFESELYARADEAICNSTSQYAKGVVNEGESLIMTTSDKGETEELGIEDAEGFSNAALWATDNFPITVIADTVKRDHILYYDSATSKLYTKMDYDTKEFSEPIDSFPGAICEGNKLTLTSDFQFVTTAKDGLFIDSNTTLYVPEGEYPSIVSAAGGFKGDDKLHEYTGIFAADGSTIDIDGSLTVRSGTGTDAASRAILSDGNLKITGDGSLTAVSGNTEHDETAEPMRADSIGIYVYGDLDISVAEARFSGGSAHGLSYGMLTDPESSVTISEGASVMAQSGENRGEGEFYDKFYSYACTTSYLTVKDNSSFIASATGKKENYSCGLVMLCGDARGDGIIYNGGITLENNSTLAVNAEGSDRSCGIAYFPNAFLPVEMDSTCTFTAEGTTKASVADLVGVTATSPDGKVLAYTKGKDGSTNSYVDTDGNVASYVVFKTLEDTPTADYAIYYDAENGFRKNIVNGEPLTDDEIPDGMSAEGNVLTLDGVKVSDESGNALDYDGQTYILPGTDEIAAYAVFEKGDTPVNNPLYFDGETGTLYSKYDYRTGEKSDPVKVPGAICEKNKLTLTSEFRFVTTHEDGLYLSDGATLYVPEGETPYIESAAGGFTRNDISSSITGIYAEDDCMLDIDGTLTVIAGDGVNADSTGVLCEGNLKITGKGTLNARGGNTSYDEAVQYDTIQYDSSGIYAYKNIDISNTEVNAYGGDAYTFSYGIVNRRNCSLTISGGAQVKAEGGSSTDTEGYCAGVGCETGEIAINDNSSLTASSVSDKGEINIGLQIISDAVDNNGTKYRGRIKLENNSSLTVKAANSKTVGYGIYPFDGTFDDAIKAEMDDSCTFTVDAQSVAVFAELKGVTAISEGKVAIFDGEKGYYTDEDGNHVAKLSFYPESAFNIAYENNAAAVTAPEGSYTVIFAAYDSGALADVKIEKVNVGAEKAASVPTPEGFDAAGKTVKVMLWGSMKNIYPLCASIDK